MPLIPAMQSVIRPLPSRLPRPALAWWLGWAWLMAVGSATAQPAVHPLLGDCPEPLSAECAARLEARALQVHAGLARREAGVLQLAPPLDTAAPPPGARWLGPLTDTGLQLMAETAPGQAPVYRLAGEGAPPLALPGPAWPAPGGRLLISTGRWGDGQAAVVLIGRVESRWRVLLRQETAAGIQLAFVGWRSDGAAARVQWTCRGASARVLQLRDGPFGWDWVPPLSAACPTQR